MSGVSTLSAPQIGHDQLVGYVEPTAPSADCSPLVGPQRLPRWHPRWAGPGQGVRGPEHLTVLLGALAPDGDFGGVTVDGSPRWAQAKRIGDRWVVEVQDGQEDWPRVVVPAQGDDAVFASLSVAAGALWSHQAVAGVIWSWLGGLLPEGYALVEAAQG